jgi:hypothetical protein
MPSAIVANEACLLTDRGWTLAKAGPSRIALFGTDRHGHLVAKEAALSVLRGASKRAVVGTDAAFGIFAPETRLVLQDGSTKLVAEIIEDSNPGELWFENALRYPSGRDEGRYIDSFCAALTDCAPFALDGAAAIRCQSRDVLEWEKVSDTGCCEFRKVSADVFCLVKSGDFPPLKGVHFQNLIRGLSIALWRNSEEECEEFDCSNSACCLWYASALQSLNLGNVLAYDALQYSLSVKVIEDSTHKPPFRRCKCAFYQSDVPEAIRVDWESNSWAPVISGFLVSGR